MSESDTAASEGIDVEPRTERALTEPLSVVTLDGTPVETREETIVMVVSSSGESYHVDAREGRCTCPDAEYNLDDDEQCKHAVRARLALGLEPVDSRVLAAVDVDSALGANAPGPRVATSDGGIIEAGDDGEILDDSDDETGDGVEDGPTYTYHWEPPHVGGAKYVRCERCGEESVPANPDRILHAEDCPERQR